MSAHVLIKVIHVAHACSSMIVRVTFLVVLVAPGFNLLSLFWCFGCQSQRLSRGARNDGWCTPHILACTIIGVCHW